MNRRQAKKQQKKQDMEYMEYLDRYFDEESKWCILNKCPYYDHIGIYGGGCINHLNNCPAESEVEE